MHNDIVTVNYQGQDYYSLKSIAKAFDTTLHHLHLGLLNDITKPDLKHFDARIIVIRNAFLLKSQRDRPPIDILVPIELGDLLIARRNSLEMVRDAADSFFKNE